MPVSEKEIQELVDMDLWQIKEIDEWTDIRRVPGGWTVTDHIISNDVLIREQVTFIPLST